MKLFYNIFALNETQWIFPICQKQDIRLDFRLWFSTLITRLSPADDKKNVRRKFCSVRCAEPWKDPLKGPFHGVVLLIAEDSDGRKDKDVKGSEWYQLAIRAILSSENCVIRERIKPRYVALDNGFNSRADECFVLNETSPGDPFAKPARPLF